MHLLGEIERHIRRTGTSETRFGREAIGDPRFVADLRNGREPRARTIDRITRYMAVRLRGER